MFQARPSKSTAWETAGLSECRSVPFIQRVVMNLKPCQPVSTKPFSGDHPLCTGNASQLVRARWVPQVRNMDTASDVQVSEWKGAQ